MLGVSYLAMSRYKVAAGPKTCGTQSDLSMGRIYRRIQGLSFTRRHTREGLLSNLACADYAVCENWYRYRQEAS